MTLGERIKKIRRMVDLTQRDFGSRIGIKPNSVSLIESGDRNASEQVLLSICREFNVNETWLRFGEGEMFSPAATTALDALAEEQNLSHGEYILIEKLLHLKPEVRQGILDYILEVASAINSSDVRPDTPANPGLDIDAEVESYRRELEIQEEAAGKSSASGGRSATG